jgi:hypothetical protein
MNNENTIINGDKNAGPTGETQTDQPALPAARSRNGKIARLPLAVRQELNKRLQNGEQGKLLVEWLNSQPEVQAILAAQFNGQPIVAPNLSAWRKGREGRTKKNGGESKRYWESTEAYQFRLLPLNSG